jgi:hypothetical protein
MVSNKNYELLPRDILDRQKEKEWEKESNHHFN